MNNFNFTNFSAPEGATTGTNNAAPVVALPGGPDFSGSGPAPQVGTAFPATQTTYLLNSTGVGPDTVADSGGATLTVQSVNGGTTKFRLTVPSASVDMTFPSTDVTNWIGYKLNYTLLGSWGVSNFGGTSAAHWGYYTAGYETPSSAMPATGTATYSGTHNVAGAVYASSVTPNLSGDASFSVNFATGAVSGSFINMVATSGNISMPWNDVAVSATIATGTSHFSGGTTATSQPSNTYAFTMGTSGHIDGGFYGPQADEIGAVWSLSDSSKSMAAIGVVGAKKQ